MRFNTAFWRKGDYNYIDHIKKLKIEELEKQKQKFYEGLKRHGIYEFDDIENLADRIRTHVVQMNVKRKFDHDYIFDHYSKAELDVKKAIEVYPVGDDGGDELQINKTVDKVGRVVDRQEEGKSRKWKLAKDIIELIASTGFYGYMWIRKKLGIPFEDPTLRPWYAKFLSYIPQFINPGGMIMLKQGMYNLTASVKIQGRKDIMLSGVGWATKLVAATNFNDSIVVVGGANSGEESNHIIVKDIYLDGSAFDGWGGRGLYFQSPVADATHSCVAENVYVYNTYQDAIEGGYAHRISIIGCWTIDYRTIYGGIHPHGTHTWIIVDNTIHSTLTATGEAIRHGDVICDNNILETGTGIIGGDNGAVIANNHIANIDRSYGIRHWDRGDRNLIIGNRIQTVTNTSVTSDGILVDGNHAIVAENIIMNVTFAGIRLNIVSDCLIENNIIIDVSQSADNTHSGIIITDDAVTASTNNVIRNNEIFAVSTTARHKYGIEEQSISDYNIIVGNRIRNAVTGGVAVVGSNTLVRDNLGHSIFKTVTANYTATWADEVILADASTAALTITLPSPASYPNKGITVKKTDTSANAVTVSPNATETIDGTTSYTLAAQGDKATFVSDGTNWVVV